MRAAQKRIGQSNLLEAIWPVGYEQVFDWERKARYEPFLGAGKNRREILGPIYGYSYSILHDSILLSVEHSGDQWRFTFNDDKWLGFACVVIEKLKLPVRRLFRRRRKPLFPVTWRFSGVSHFSLNKVNRNQKILPVSVLKWLPRLDEFLYDDIVYKDDGCVEMAAWFWCRKPRWGENILMLIRAGSLEIEAPTVEHWRAIFGDGLDGYFHWYAGARREEEERGQGKELWEKVVLAES